MVFFSHHWHVQPNINENNFFFNSLPTKAADDQNKTKQNKITVNKPTDDQNKNNIEQNKKIKEYCFYKKQNIHRDISLPSVTAKV